MTRICGAGLFAVALALTLVAAPADAPHKHAAHFIAHSVDTGLRNGYMVAVADLNRDGKPDLVPIVSQIRDLTWYENVAGAAATSSTQFPASRAPRQ